MNSLLRIVAFAILSLPMILVHQAAQNAWGTGWAGFIAFILLYAMDFWIAVIAHEAGHAIAAHLFKWRIAYVAVFPVAYHLEAKKLAFWTHSSGDLGGAVSIAAMPQKTRGKVAILFAAGPIFNFLLAAIVVGLASILPPPASDIIGSLAMMSLLLGIGNLIPWRSRAGAKSDGAMLISLAMIRRTVSRRKAA